MSCVSMCDQSTCDSSHQERSLVYMMFQCGSVMFLITRSFDVAKFHIKPLSLLFSYKRSFLAVGLKTSSVRNFAWKFSIIFIWYVGKWSNNCCNSWQKRSFELSLLSLVRVCTPRAVVSHQRPLNSIHDFLWLTNCTLWTAVMILWCVKNPHPNRWFSFSFPQKKVKSSAHSVCPMSHLISCTPTKGTVYLANFLAAVLRGLTYADPSHSICQISSIFLHLQCSKNSVQVQGCLYHFIHGTFLEWCIVSLSPKSKAGGPPLLGCPWMLIQYICSYPLYVRQLSICTWECDMLCWWMH